MNHQTHLSASPRLRVSASPRLRVSASPRLRVSASLRRLRGCKFVHLIQFIAMFWWSLAPSLSHAVYVPDANDEPLWVPLSLGDTAPASGPDMSLDENEVVVWRAQFAAAQVSGAVVFWSGGTRVVNGVEVSYNGVWHVAGAGDADQDEIPDDLDPYPGDQSNNSFWWQGGAFMKYNTTLGVNIYHVFRAQWYAGNSNDNNGNTMPDVLESWFDNPSAHGTLQQFPGGTFLILGSYSTFDPFQYHAPSVTDTDLDGLPDEIDPFVTDAWNDTHYDWPGGDFYIDGVSTHYEPEQINGVESDVDSDDIPDVADPYTEDAANNSSLWQGGEFTIDGITQNLPAQWHRADAGDADGDTIPEDIDPYPGDGGNPTPPPNEFYWSGGSFVIDGQSQTLPAGSYTGSGDDPDMDSIPNDADPYTDDAANNSAWWPGGTFTVSNQQQSFPAQWHRADAGDTDGDTIPDDIDPDPSDPNNGNTTTFHWSGGTFIIDGLPVFFAGQDYTGSSTDPDGDTIPNAADPYQNDGTNNSYQWAGGEVIDNGIFVRFGSGWYAGTYLDGNSNNVPDCLDDWFADPSTQGDLQQWAGGSFDIQGTARTWPQVKYHAAQPNDSDLDTIPDEIDPLPSDQNNGNGFTWPITQTDILYGNVLTNFSPTWYGGAYADADADTIPNQAETAAYVNDSWNGNDSDGDNIPDKTEALYEGTLDRLNPYDAVWLRSDGISYLRVHQYNVEGATKLPPLASVPLTADFPTPPVRDTDNDGMTDQQELRFSLNPFDMFDAVDSYAGDLALNFEKLNASISPWVAVNSTAYQSITGQSYEDALAHHDFVKSAAENDWDGDLVANIDEVLLFHTSARDVNTRPSDPEIIQAIVGGTLMSVTTLTNFLYLITPCSCANSACPHNFSCNRIPRCAGPGQLCSYTPPPPPPCHCVNWTSNPSTNKCTTCIDPIRCTNGNCYTAPPPGDCTCGADGCPGQNCSGAGAGTSSCDCGDEDDCDCQFADDGCLCIVDGECANDCGEEENPCDCANATATPKTCTTCTKKGDCTGQCAVCPCGGPDCPATFSPPEPCLTYLGAGNCMYMPHQICQPAPTDCTCGSASCGISGCVCGGVLKEDETCSTPTDAPPDGDAVSEFEISFSGTNYHQLKSDNGGTDYSSPHYKEDSDGNLEHNYPVAYTKNKKIKLSAKMKLAVEHAGKQVKVSAYSTDNFQMDVATVTAAADGLVTLSATESKVALRDRIAFFNGDESNNAYTILWRLRIDNDPWITFGATQHTVYVTKATPNPSANYETLFNIACRNAKGKTGDQAIVDAIYHEFKDRSVQRVKPSSGDLDGDDMTYWQPGGD